MPNRRAPAPTRLQGPQLTARAYQIDTYQRPTGAGAELRQLAESLGQIAPSLLRFAQTQGQLEDERTRAAARDTAFDDFETLQAEQKEYAQARAEGLIETHQDPYFRQYYDNQIGQLLAGDAFAQWLEVKDAQLTNAVTLDDYDKAFSEFYADYQQRTFGEDSSPTVGFQRVFQQQVASDRQSFAREAGQRMRAQTIESLGAQASAFTRTVFSQGGDTSDYARGLEDMVQNWRDAMGPDATPAEKAAAQDAAVLGFLGALEVLAADPNTPQGAALALASDVMNSARFGTSVAADNPRLAGLLREARGRIATTEGMALRAQRRGWQETLNDTVDDAWTAMLSGESILEHLAVINGLPGEMREEKQSARNALLNAQRSLLFNDDLTTDQRVFASISRAIIGSVPEDIPGLRMRIRNETGHTLTGQAALQLDGELQSLERLWGVGRHARGESIDGIFENEVVSSAQSMLERAIRGSLEWSDSVTPIREHRGFLTWRRRLISFLQANPDAPIEQIEDYATKAAEEEAGRYLSGDSLEPFLDPEMGVESVPYSPEGRFMQGPALGTGPQGKALYESLREFSRDPDQPLSVMLLEQLRASGLRPQEIMGNRMGLLDRILELQSRYYETPQGN